MNGTHMRAITVRQPWAWAIAHGGKDVENRTRNIAGDYRGLVAIHAGLAQMSALSGVLADMFWENAAGWPGPTSAPRGCVVAVANLNDVHTSRLDAPCPGGRWADDRCSTWAIGGHWHLHLANPRPLATPVPAKGRLGLWTLPPDVEAAVLAQIGDPT